MRLIDFLFGKKKSQLPVNSLGLQAALDEASEIVTLAERDQVECLRCLTNNPGQATQCRNCGAYLDEDTSRPVGWDKPHDDIERAELHIYEMTVGDGRDDAALSRYLTHPQPRVRSTAAAAVGNLKITEQAATLISFLRDTESIVREQAAKALGNLANLSAVTPLIDALSDPDWAVRKYAAESLGQLNDPRAVQPLIRLFEDTDISVHCAVVRALGALGDRNAFDVLIRALEESNDSLRELACESLGKIGDPRAVERLLVVLGQEEFSPWPITRKAIIALGQLGDPIAILPILGALEHHDTLVRWDAVKALAMGILRDSRIEQALIAALKDSSWVIRRDAAQGLARYGSAAAIEPLKTALADEETRDPQTRDDVRHKIERSIEILSVLKREP